jgi:hypothetical protein
MKWLKYCPGRIELCSLRPSAWRGSKAVLVVDAVPDEV